MKASDFSGKLRDTKVERELARQLRELSEPVVFEFVQEMLEVHEIVALDLARKTLKSKESFYRLLHVGLERANASSIRRWLECVIPRIGIRNVIANLVDKIDQYPDGVARAIYFIPQMIDEEARKLVAQAYERTEALLRERMTELKQVGRGAETVLRWRWWRQRWRWWWRRR